MTTEPQNHEPQTRPVFKFLAGFFGILFSIAGIAAVIFAFQSSGAALTRGIAEASLLLLMGAALLFAFYTSSGRPA